MDQGRPYRIGIDARFWRSATGGIGRYTRELVHHLAAIDHDNEYTIFITPADVPEYDLNQPNFHAHVVPITHYSYSEQTRFLTVLNRAKLDLVHFLNYNHPILYRRPFVSTLQDLTVYFYPIGRSQKSKLRRMAFTQTLKHSLAGAEAVLSVSKNSARDAEKVFRISPSKIRVIYEGGPDVVDLPPNGREQVAQYLKTDQPYFLFVSQWRPHKGIMTLIDAFAEFKRATAGPHKLVLAGRQKDLAHEVREALDACPFRGDIISPGFVPEELLGSLYENAAAYILPSFYEGFGLMILEAFAYGVPAIVSRNSSLPELGGDAVLYFPTGDAKALANEMERLVGDTALRHDLIAKGRQQLKKFSWDKCAKETLACYRDVLTKNRR